VGGDVLGEVPVGAVLHRDADIEPRPVLRHARGAAHPHSPPPLPGRGVGDPRIGDYFTKIFSHIKKPRNCTRTELCIRIRFRYQIFFPAGSECKLGLGTSKCRLVSAWGKYIFFKPGPAGWCFIYLILDSIK